MRKLALAALLVALAPAAQTQDTNCSGVIGSGLITLNCTTTQPTPLPVGPGPKRGASPWYDEYMDKVMGSMGLVWTCKQLGHGVEFCEWDKPPKQEVAP